MREILFRGKRLDNGEWVFGSLLPEGNGDKEFYIIEDVTCGISMCMDESFGHMITQVDPATIGQYTGLKDRHDKKIFEGDVINIIFRDGAESMRIEWDSHRAEYQFVSNDGRWTVTYTPVEVIGNIHDNPELP